MFLKEVQNHPDEWMYGHLRYSFPNLEKEELDIRICEFLKFMYISSIKGSGFVPLTKEIDEIWHEFILQTKEYETLCMDLPGKVFIHHQTSSLERYTETRDRKDVLENMLEWLPNYYYYFGEFTEKTAGYWMMVQFLSKEMHLSLEQINQIAREESARLQQQGVINQGVVRG